MTWKVVTLIAGYNGGTVSAPFDHDDNDWRAKFVKGYSPTGVSMIDETISKLDTGGADALRIGGAAGEMSLDRVDARIARYQAEVDSLTGAYTRAAILERDAAKAGGRGNPADLDAATYALLKKHNYIAGRPGAEHFTIPAGGRSLGGLKSDLNLPGDHLLNAISGRNFLEAAASAYVPGASAGKVGALLEGLNVGRRTVQASVFATDLAAGAILGGATEYAKTGKVDPSKIAIESVLMQGALGSLGKATQGTAKALTQYISKPGVRDATEKALALGLGLSSEAALQTYYQSSISGDEMSYDAFLANMLNGAMSRAGSKVIETPVVRDMPKRLRSEIDARQAMVDRAKVNATERLKKVLGDEIVTVTRPDGTIGIGARPGDDIGSFSRDDGSSVLGFTPGARAEHITKAMDDALRAGKISWPELKMLYADNKALEPILKAVNEKRTKYFSDIVAPAQRMAESDLRAEYSRDTARLQERYADDPAALKLATDRAKNTFDAELALIRTNPRSPGSDNLTSDVDRSIASERVRRKLKEIYRNADGELSLPASSARSYDVNEYIDVFPVINKTLPLADKIASLPVESGDFKGLNHEQANQAQGYATAMLHMNADQRAQYRENILGKTKDRTLTEKQLTLAKTSLDRADTELRTEMERLAGDNPSLSQNRSDLAIKARDNLYGQRTESIRKKANQLLHVENDMAALAAKGVKDDAPEMQALSQERNKLAAEMQRDWGYTLREGIETYASFTGLDAIVNDGQIAKRKIRELINDDGYVRLRPGESADGLPENATIKRLSDGQVDNFLNDQVMMMTHHANGFHKGSEGVIDAGSAMGKYAERAVLALKLQGKDLSVPPYSTLKKAAEEMVLNRSNPTKLREVMEHIGLENGGDNSAKAGLLELMKMVQAAVPETRGLWDPKKMGLTPDPIYQASDAGNMLRVKSQLATRMRLMEEEEEVLQRYGPGSAAEANKIKQLRIDSEVERLKAQKEQRKELGSRYLKKDWKEAAALEEKDAELKARMERIRQLRGTINSSDPVYKAFQANNARLAELRKAYTDGGGTGTYAPDDDDKAIDARIARLEEEKALRQTAGERYASFASEATERRAAIGPLPDGEIADIALIPPLPADVLPDGELRIRLGNASLSLPIVALGGE